MGDRSTLEIEIAKLIELASRDEGILRVVKDRYLTVTGTVRYNRNYSVFRGRFTLTSASGEGSFFTDDILWIEGEDITLKNY